MFDTEKRWWISNQEAIYQKLTCHGGNEIYENGCPESSRKLHQLIKRHWRELVIVVKGFAGQDRTPAVKSFLMSIAEDSHKHSLLLEGCNRQHGNPKNQKAAQKETGEAWTTIDTFHKEICSLSPTT